MSESSNDEGGAVSQARESTAAGPFDGEEYVRWAYRLLLGREPDSLKAVQNNPYKNDRQSLIRQVLNSDEFRQSPEVHRYTALFATPNDNPYASWNKAAIAFIHLPKTGGTTLSTLLKACFSPDRICPQGYNALHFYSPVELARYDLFVGHYDYFSLNFIPRQHVRRLSIVRDPVERLISFYRFARTHSPRDKFANVWTKLANELSVEEFYEHELAISSRSINNSYLFSFGSSMDDDATLTALTSAPIALDATTPDARADDEFCGPILARATQRILDLDAIGLTERFQESVEIIFATLGFLFPQSITPVMVTDEFAASDARFSRVPPAAMTARLSRALERLTKYDRILYDVAKGEFERRRSSAAPNTLDLQISAMAGATGAANGVGDSAVV
jgi:hypothetical protein